MFTGLRVQSPRGKLVGCIICLFLTGTVSWLVLTEHDSIWPIRNTVQYHVLSWWWMWVGTPNSGVAGVLEGFVRDAKGNPLQSARVLVARYDGTAYSAETDNNGRFRIPDIPAGAYRPVAGATGYDDNVIGGFWSPVVVRPDTATEVDVQLVRSLHPVEHQLPTMRLEQAIEASCKLPFPCRGQRRTVRITAAHHKNQLVYYYTPLSQEKAELPILLCVYPGPADLWESVSLTLVAENYAVIAAGPDYTFAMETQVDDLMTLLTLAQDGKFPDADPSRIALVGGSYSSLHVERMLERGVHVKAVLLMGPVVDLFDMRRRLEDGTFIPPYGLDAALRSLGFPNRHPFRYWQYSGLYHIHADFPPISILHSKADEIVPYQQSEAFAEALEEAGVPHEVHFFDGGSHYLFAGDESWREMYNITLKFLAAHLREPVAVAFGPFHRREMRARH